jgi:hypothetical protein
VCRLQTSFHLGACRFVGYFCIAAGIGLGINRDIGSIASCAQLHHLVTTHHPWSEVGLVITAFTDTFPSRAPGRLVVDTAILPQLGATLAATAALLLVLKVCQNPLALPLTLLVIPGMFHIIRIALGATMDDAIAKG